MKNLFLAIVLIAYLFLVFRIFQKYKINSFHAVVINYYICAITGILYLGYIPSPENFKPKGLLFGILTGSLFMPTFYLMALTVEKVNISVATVANKMSLIIPVVFSYFYLRKGPEKFSIINITGIVLAILAIVLTSIKNSGKEKGDEKNILLLLLPVLLFISGGTIDTMVNYVTFTFLTGDRQGEYSVLLFATAAAFGTLALIIRIIFTGEFLKWHDLVGGIVLGVPNYFSLYFFMKTLSDFNNDGALVYPVVNIGVIVVASLQAVFFFKEKLSPVNLAGICLSVLSLVLIFW